MTRGGRHVRHEKRLQALVVYESMFGCTEEIAYAVAEGLRIEGVAVEAIDVRDGSPADDVDVDLLVVGAPTHAFSLSRPATRADALRQGARAGTDSTGLREWLDARRSQAVPVGRLAAAFDTRADPGSSSAEGRFDTRGPPSCASGLPARGATDARSSSRAPVARLRPSEVDRAVAWGRVIAREAMA